MGRIVRSCLQSLLKLVNSAIGMVGIAMILYSLWMFRICYKQIDGDDFPIPWFIYAFLGLGITLCVITCSGHIAAETLNGHCLSCYMVFVFLLFLLEAAVTADVLLNRHWEDDFPEDPVVTHYYPYCPQPDLTLGLGSHTDPGVLTVVLQNQIGGLQVKHGEEWVAVDPMPGALVINIGDLLQIMSNDEYKSVEHRVLANPFCEPRVSMATFFNPGRRMDTDYYGPLIELVSHDKPALYRNFTLPEFFKELFTRELGGLVDYFKL